MPKPLTDPVRLVGNLLALLLLPLLLAFGADAIWRWFGGSSSLYCGLLPSIRIGFGMTTTLLLGFVGFVLWVISGFRSRRALIFFAGAVALTIAPDLLGAHLGVSCAPNDPTIIQPDETAPIALPRARPGA